MIRFDEIETKQKERFSKEHAQLVQKIIEEIDDQLLQSYSRSLKSVTIRMPVWFKGTEDYLRALVDAVSKYREHGWNAKVHREQDALYPVFGQMRVSVEFIIPDPKEDPQAQDSPSGST